MTREDAILHMTLRREELKHSVGDLDEDIKAFDMAIEALEQKPCEDAISRSDAIRVASGYCHWSNIPKELANLPSVSTEKTGYWKELLTSDICSLCGLTTGKTTPKMRYCPGCGAKMEVEE